MGAYIKIIECFTNSVRSEQKKGPMMTYRTKKELKRETNGVKGREINGF